MSRSDRFETFQYQNGRWQVVNVDPKPRWAAQGDTEAAALLAMLDDAESRPEWDGWGA